MHQPTDYFSFQPVLHDWCNNGRGMCYPVCGMVHIKEPLLLIGKISLCGGSGFPFSLSEWSLTICLTPYNLKNNVLSASLNKTFPSFQPTDRIAKWVLTRDRPDEPSHIKRTLENGATSRSKKKNWETGKRYLRVYIHLRFRHARSRAQPLAWPVTLSVAGVKKKKKKFIYIVLNSTLI